MIPPKRLGTICTPYQLLKNILGNVMKLQYISHSSSYHKPYLKWVDHHVGLDRVNGSNNPTFVFAQAGYEPRFRLAQANQPGCLRGF